MDKNCRITGTQFKVTEQDKKFYEKMGVPTPTLSPDERQLRRMSWRNERNLHHRKCDLCSKQIISIYPALTPYTVYCHECWWSDKWDAMNFGRDFDFNRSFFEQMNELIISVPRLALFQRNNQNCEYTNYTENNRDCYLCIDSARSQNIYYSKWMINDQDCSDSYNVEDSQLCYEDLYQVGGYMNIFNFFSDFSTESAFLYGSTNCKNCFMCFNQHRKEYMIRNKQVSKEEYENFMQSIDLGSYKQLESFKKEYIEMIDKAPKRTLQIMSEDSVGDCMFKCKNVTESFDLIQSRDCRYCYESGHLTDCFDVYESAFDCERQYECHGCNRGKFLRFCNSSHDLSESDYADHCHNSSNLFASSGLRRKQYCILNKQYTKEEYEQVSQRIIEHMKSTKEWGEFFPSWMSPFAYNESIAIEYYLLDKTSALARGYKWRDEDNASGYQGQIHQLPDNIKDAPEDIGKKILKCEVSGKLYKIIPQEFALLKKLGIALPRRSPQQRYKDRLQLVNHRRLWDWQCKDCKKKMRAPYLPESGQNVYCQDCFLKLKYD